MTTRISPDNAPSRHVSKPIRRVLRWLLILLVIAFLVEFIMIPIGFAVAANRAPRESVGSTPEGFDEVRLTANDGVHLAAWYAPPENGAVIVLVHGATESREAVRPYAQMLADHGFGVLAFDMRGHGESDGVINAFGWHGSDDMRAALAFLSGQTGIAAVGGLGLSLGGEVLLGAASANPALTAIVSEGASDRSLEEFHALPSHRNPVSSLQPWVMYTTVRLLTGDAPPLPLLDSVRATDSTRFLLIAAENARDEAEFNAVFAEAAPGRADLWVVPNVGHVGGFERYPDEYEQRVIAFFTAALLPE